MRKVPWYQRRASSLQENYKTLVRGQQLCPTYNDQLIGPLVVTRRMLTRLYGQQPIGRKDITDIQSELERAKTDLLARAARIPESPKGPPTFEGNTQFNRWARLLLSALSDKNWCFAYSPMLRSTISQAWLQLYPV